MVKEAEFVAFLIALTGVVPQFCTWWFISVTLEALFGSIPPCPAIIAHELRRCPAG